jgi:hypothetical protein
MTIYSVVRTVKPGTPTSMMKGDTEVNHYGDSMAAYRCTTSYNSHAGCSGITYRVDVVDEESPDRVPTEAMRKANQSRALRELNAYYAICD